MIHKEYDDEEIINFFQYHFNIYLPNRENEILNWCSDNYNYVDFLYSDNRTWIKFRKDFDAAFFRLTWGQFIKDLVK